MTNFEYYKDKILMKISKEEGFGLKNGEIVSCIETNCSKCDFNFKGMRCSAKRILWLYEEHVEKPKLSKKERLFCELVEQGWITRGKNELLYFYNKKPRKGDQIWVSEESYTIIDKLISFEPAFKFIKFEDNDPWAVVDLLKLEVED